MNSAKFRYIADRGQWFDLNATSNRWSIPVRGYATATVHGVVREGTWATAVLTLKRSNDGLNSVALQDADSDITTLGPGNDQTKRFATLGFDFLHIELTTVEGGTGSADLTVSLSDQPD